MAEDQELEHLEAELGDALRRLVLLNDRSTEIVAALQAAGSAGSFEKFPALTTQLAVVEARRTRATTIAETASQRLSRLRHRVQEG